MKPYAPILIVLMLVTASFVGVSYNLEKSSTVSFDGNTLYVGGSGEGNYTKIQDAIDKASDGDTVFVYNGTYYEHIIINVSINLIGEDKETTIIDGEFKGNCVVIKADGVVVKRFTIRNAYWGPGGDRYFGLVIKSSYNKVSENKLHHHYYNSIIIDNSNNEVFSNYVYASNRCIGSYGGKNNSIYNNTLNTGDTAITIYHSHNNVISNNIVESAVEKGILVDTSNNNIIINNKVSNCRIGLKVFNSRNIKISHNNIQKNDNGVIINNAFNITISYNNFLFNKQHAEHLSFPDCQWIENYWGRPRLLPKIIFGRRYVSLLFQTILFPVFNFDWHPAQEPYDI